MHPDTPIRVLDEVIRRYGVTCVQLSPFEGGGYGVRIGSRAEPVNVGAGSLGEALGKAFLELIRKTGGPSFEELLERSSLGTPHAKRLRAEAGKPVKVSRHTYQNPAVHWYRYPKRVNDAHADLTSACGMVRVGSSHARFTEVLADVTCGRCKATSWYKQEASLS